MNIAFYVAGIVAIVSTVMVITRLTAVHALLYLVISLLSAAVIFYSLGSPFVAALEVIVYAGAIMVLFIFVIMMLNLGPTAIEQESRWFNPKTWVGPAILAVILLGEFFYVFTSYSAAVPQPREAMVTPRQVGISLFSTYLLGVELASILLLAGLVGAYHLGRRKPVVIHRFLEKQRDTLHPHQQQHERTL